MRFLNSLNDKLRSQVELIVEDDVLDFAEKFTILNDLIVDSDVLRQILDFLNTNEKKIERKPNTNDFLKFVGEKKQTLMRLMIDREDFNMLDKLISRESEEAQKAYDEWINWKRTVFQKKASDDGPSMRESVEPTEDEEKAESHATPHIGPDFFKQFPDCVNILILGETGVGKSTFINGLVNYLKYRTIDEAQKNKVEILIKTWFTHTDKDYNRTRVECDPTIAVEHGENEDEIMITSQSPKSYLASWGPEDSKKMIRIIDTPSFGSRYGLEEDKNNFSKLISLITKFKEIHAVCILLNPNESDLSLSFCYCLNELLTRFHKSIVKNIFFCFTKARQTFYMPGNTLPLLELNFKDLKEKRGTDILLSRYLNYF